MTNKIIEAANLPQEEKVYLKKDFLGWRVVEPWKNPETGKVNWFNFFAGGKRALSITIFLMLLLGIAYLGYREQIENFKVVMENPCSFCIDCQDQVREMLSTLKGTHQINLTGIKITSGGQA